MECFLYGKICYMYRLTQICLLFHRQKKSNFERMKEGELNNNISQLHPHFLNGQHKESWVLSMILAGM